jgi:hypothetical protein
MKNPKYKITIRPSKKGNCGFTLTINGKYIATFNSRGSAKAGAQVEIRRMETAI